MINAEVIFVCFVAAVVLLWAAWMFAPRDSRFMQFWIDLTGRRTARPPSTKRDDK
jgi:Immunity protein 17